jgi:CheY-like chemotaxis protein
VWLSRTFRIGQNSRNSTSATNAFEEILPENYWTSSQQAKYKPGKYFEYVSQGNSSDIDFQFHENSTNSKTESTGSEHSGFQTGKKVESLNVLIAEDNPLNQKLMLLILKHFSLTAKIASNGKEALEMALNENFDLILMDIQMPIMDGIEASRQIMQQHPEPPVIVAVTAFDDPETKQACFDAGMSGFVAKPVGLNEVKNALARHFVFSNE